MVNRQKRRYDRHRKRQRDWDEAEGKIRELIAPTLIQASPFSSNMQKIKSQQMAGTLPAMHTNAKTAACENKASHSMCYKLRQIVNTNRVTLLTVIKNICEAHTVNKTGELDAPSPRPPL